MRKVAFVITLAGLVLALSLGAATQEGRTGAWVDEVVFFEEIDAAKAVAMIEGGDAHVYGLGITDPDLVQQIEASEVMSYEVSYGSFNEILLNHAGTKDSCEAGGPFFSDGTFNPFGVPRIREAIQYLVDRIHITQEIMGGTGMPRWTMLDPNFPTYAAVVETTRAIEIAYAHDKEKARQIITEEMEKLGAELVDGTWHYDGEPVELIGLIRVEDERLEIGHYVATELEDMGFVVDRQEKTSAEAAPIWLLGDPCDGEWSYYTGGWISTAIDREQGCDWDFFYTKRAWPVPLFTRMRPDPELDEAADRLCRRDFDTNEERLELVAKAQKLAMKDSTRIFTHSRVSRWPHPVDVAVTADIAAGISGSYLWPYTLSFLDEGGNPVKGGTIQFASPSIMTQPWNAIAGSNWLYDMMIIRATADDPFKPDPFTGLAWPQRVKRAQVFVKEGLPVIKNLDWVELEFVPEIEVPADAWIDWDAVNQEFITVGEKHPDGLTAKTKTIISYDDDLFENEWHHGGKMSLGDMVISFILTFDRAKEESPLYDEAYVPTFESFQKMFKGARIVQEDPVVVEVYSDLWYLDAETIADSRAGYFWPVYDQGIASWEALAVGILAETAKELAFGEDKADKLGVDRMNYIAGPSLEILKGHFAEALAEGYIPYEPTLGQYIDQKEVLSRYALLEKWLKEKGHLWVGLGPLYLDSVDPTAKIAVAKRFEAYRDPADKWLRFAEPKFAEVEVSGPTEVEIGTAADFQADVTFKGEPYPADEIDFATFLVFDATGQLAFSGDAEVAGDGLVTVSLSGEQTANLVAGSNRLEVALALKPVAKPSFGSITFVTVSP